MTTSLLDFLRARIASGGPMPFAAYMSHVLYHPRHGYYAAGPERSGWDGHFITSPELDPAFAELWTRAFEQIWSACERPADFVIVEIGPGEGAFARGVLATAEGAFRQSLTYRLIERIPGLERRQRELLSGFEQVDWVRSVTECPRAAAGVVFANEVVDNLPVHLVEVRKGELLEVCVGIEGDGIGFVASPPSSPELQTFLDRVGVTLPEGHRMEVPLAAESFVGRAAGLVEYGAVLIVDYGASAADLALRPHGSLLAYSESGIDEDVLDRPGSKDVTAHANWTAIERAMRAAGMTVAGPVPQGDVLRSLGLDALDERLREDHNAAVAEGRGADAIRALSRRQALGALGGTHGLGALGVMGGTVGIRLPAFLTPQDKNGPGKPGPSSGKLPAAN